MSKKWIGLAISMALALSSSAGDWPQFSGPTRDNISMETGLADSWPEGGPEVLWEKEVSDGYSSAAIKGGKVYFIDRENEESVLRCLDLTNGDELWKCAIVDPGTMQHQQFAGTRGTPTVTDDSVYFATGWGTLACVDLESKEVKWKHNLLTEFELDLHMWGMSQSPYLYEDLVLVAPTAKSAGVAAFNKNTGELIWKSTSIGGYAFASPVVYTIGGEDMVVAVGSQEAQSRSRSRTASPQPDADAQVSGVYGISPEDGSVLWNYAGWQGQFAIPFPTLVPGDRLFITSGYNAGAAMIRLEKTEQGYKAIEVFKSEEVSPQIHQPIYLDDHLMIVNNGMQRNDGLICVNLDGEIEWRSKDIENAPTFERGAFVLVDGKIVILDAKTGKLHLLKADVSEYKEIASAPMVQANNMAWAPLALSDGKLIVRDWTTLKCIDLK